LAAWRESLGATELERHRWYRVMVGHFKRRMIQFRGLPPETKTNHKYDPPLHLLWFADVVLITYWRVETAPKPQKWWIRLFARHSAEPDVTVTIIGWTPVLKQT